MEERTHRTGPVTPSLDRRPRVTRPALQDRLGRCRPSPHPRSSYGRDDLSSPSRLCSCRPITPVRLESVYDEMDKQQFIPGLGLMENACAEPTGKALFRMAVDASQPNSRQANVTPGDIRRNPWSWSEHEILGADVTQRGAARAAQTLAVHPHALAVLTQKHHKNWPALSTPHLCDHGSQRFAASAGTRSAKRQTG